MKNFRKISVVILLFLVFQSIVKAQISYQSQNISMLGNWYDSTVIAEPAYGIKFNGIWGWNDHSGREYGIIGSTAGTFFINVTDPANPVKVGFVPSAHGNCIWHEVKTYSHYAYIVGDDVLPNTFQIVDLQYLPDSIHIVLNNANIFARSHTLFIDGDRMYCASVKGGANPDSKMAVYSLANPELPVQVTTIENDYPNLTFEQAHDIFARNDTVFVSDGYTGLFIFIYNHSTDHLQYINSLTTYPSQGYNHSSALSADGRTLVFADEVPGGLPVKVLDVSDLQNLVVRSTFSSDSIATPHNPFMLGNICFIAYYQDGLQVYDVSVPSSPVRAGYFDTHYQTPLGGPYLSNPYAGAWGAYPYLPSGNVLVSDMQNGLFVLDASEITGVKNHDPAATNVIVYPNPAGRDETVRIKFPVTGDYKISFIDLSGRTVLTDRFVTGNFFDFQPITLESGNYLLKIEGKSDVSVKKIFIR